MTEKCWYCWKSCDRSVHITVTNSNTEREQVAYFCNDDCIVNWWNDVPLKSSLWKRILKAIDVLISRS